MWYICYKLTLNITWFVQYFVSIKSLRLCNKIVCNMRAHMKSQSEAVYWWKPWLSMFGYIYLWKKIVSIFTKHQIPHRIPRSGLNIALARQTSVASIAKISKTHKVHALALNNEWTFWSKFQTWLPWNVIFLFFPPKKIYISRLCIGYISSRFAYKLASYTTYE